MTLDDVIRLLESRCYPKDIAAQLRMQSDMDYAVAAGDAVLMAEQAGLLRECRKALDKLLLDRPSLGAFNYGNNSLGGLKVELYAYRPQGIFGTIPNVDFMQAQKEVFGDDIPNITEEC